MSNNWKRSDTMPWLCSSCGKHKKPFEMATDNCCRICITQRRNSKKSLYVMAVEYNAANPLPRRDQWEVTVNKLMIQGVIQ